MWVLTNGKLYNLSNVRSVFFYKKDGEWYVSVETMDGDMDLLAVCSSEEEAKRVMRKLSQILRAVPIGGNSS
ncbi:MAG: hypothetical protein GXO18_00940 [Aquificae bacterium]|nr:hypothetical protein [Aquificota bacterium]